MRTDELPPFLRVDQAQALTQLGRSQIYQLMRRWHDTNGAEGIPVVRFGRCARIPTAKLLALAGLESDGGGASGGRTSGGPAGRGTGGGSGGGRGA